MPKLLVATLVVVLVAASRAVAGPYDDGAAALARGDYATAIRLWQPLAEEGDALAQSQMGVLYLNGRGVRQDYAQALLWFNRAAAQGEANAEYNLAVMHRQGTGVPRDNGQADEWYALAAEQGIVQAQGDLGYMYATGQGVPRDFAIALFWFNLAAAGGDTTAADNGRLAAAQLSASDIARVYKLTREWKPTKRR